MVKKKPIVGYVSTIEDYTISISVQKAVETADIWPLKSPIPVYLKDNNGNNFLLYKTEKISPSSDLPSLSVIDGQNVLEISPAKSFILESGLTALQAHAIIIKPESMPTLMSEITLMTEEEISKCWKEKKFDYLKLIARILHKEFFLNYLKGFCEQFSKLIKNSDILRQSLLKTLTEIGSNHDYFENEDFNNAVRVFMADNSVAILIEQKSQKIKAIYKNKELKYGDLVSFSHDNGKYLMIVENIDNLLTLQPLLGIFGNKTRMSFSPLPKGSEGSIEDVENIIQSIYDEVNEDYYSVPVGELPNVRNPYEILIKGNILIHFAIIAISGRGKGNFNKKFIFEIMKQQVEFFSKNDDPSLYEGLGVILFDDVGEYVKCLKPQDWGLDMATIGLYYHYNKLPLLKMVDISITEWSPSDYDIKGNQALFDCITPNPAKIPLEYIPIEEVLRSLEGMVAYDVIPIAMRHYYRKYPSERPTVSEQERLSLGFINWFLDEEDTTEDSCQIFLERFRFMPASINAARRGIRTFLFESKKYLGIVYSTDTGLFGYDESFLINGRFNDAFNLLSIAQKSADHGEILVLDESGLPKTTKLFIQRVILNHILTQRESRGFDPKINPCLFIIEEATVLMRESGGSQLNLFAEVAVKARKFGIGIGLIFQNVDRVDPILLQQLGWTVIMGLPVDAMRKSLAKNVPSDINPYDIYVKKADIGIAIGIQQVLGGSVTLPFKVSYYEKDVARLFTEFKKAESDVVFNNIEKLSIQNEVIITLKNMIENIQKEMIYNGEGT